MFKLNQKNFLILVGILFSFISAVHLARALFSWEFVIGQIELPAFWSYYISFVLIILASVSFNLSGVKLFRKTKKSSFKNYF